MTHDDKLSLKIILARMKIKMNSEVGVERSLVLEPTVVLRKPCSALIYYNTSIHSGTKRDFRLFYRLC